MRIYKAFVDFEKEEQYLNNMAKQGYAFKKCSVIGMYYFANDEKKDLNYRIDFRTFKKKEDFEEYILLFEDFGWKHVDGTKNSGSQYFLSMDSHANNEIFSSKESFAARHKSLYEICSMTFITMAMYVFVILMTNDFKLSNLGFLTPGIWEKTGADLVRSVLFEFPFVFMRIGFPILMAFIGLIYGIWAYKAKMLYKRKL